jgi:hypothetical protein
MDSSRYDLLLERVSAHKAFTKCSAAALGAMLLLATASPVLARYPVYQNVRTHDSAFNEFLEAHKKIAAELRAEPELVYDPAYRAKHPSLGQYLAAHPAIWDILNEGGPQGSWGAYDSDHQWRAAYWWHQNHTGWFWDKHPEWSALNLTWRAQDGDYDASGGWHDRPWWRANNPEWVAANHPDWENDSP